VHDSSCKLLSKAACEDMHVVGDRYLATTDPIFGVGCLKGGLNCSKGQEEQEH
jgi:hypothetical protein